jgi:hypothetical protein
LKQRTSNSGSKELLILSLTFDRGIDLLDKKIKLAFYFTQIGFLRLIFAVGKRKQCSLVIDTGWLTLSKFL